MNDRKLTQKDAAALRAALAEEYAVPAGETERAVQALAPQISAAAVRLADKRRERRSVRLQALALAGCSLLFLTLAALGYKYWAFFLANPARWGTALGIATLSILLVACLPLFIKRREYEA